MSGKLKAVLLMIVMFGLGIFSGVAWETFQFHHMGPPHMMFAERRVQRLTSELKLSPTQEKDLRDILQKAHERADQVNEEVSWDLADIHRDSVQAIRKILTAEQLQKFEVMHKKFHKRHKNMSPDDENDGPPSPPAPGPHP